MPSSQNVADLPKRSVGLCLTRLRRREYSLALRAMNKKILHIAETATPEATKHLADLRAPKGVELDADEALALVQFFNRLWSSRVWVVQEVCSRISRPPLAVCGEFIINWV
jgi:hypothetical protein